MNKYNYDPPLIIKKICKNYLWETINSKVLLTFDDGPIEENTLRILEFLNEKNIKSVFFCVGNNIKKNPSIARKILENGHLIGNHMFNHTNIRTISKRQIQDEIDEFNKITLGELNYKAEYFRPPYGRLRLGLSKLLLDNDLKNVMWSLLTYDYKNDINIVKFALNKYLKKNSIVVFHDNKSCQDIIIDSLKIFVKEAEKRNFEIGDPLKCLK